MTTAWPRFFTTFPWWTSVYMGVPPAAQPAKVIPRSMIAMNLIVISVDLLCCFPAITTQVCWLIGDAGVIGAIREVGCNMTAAEEEIGSAGVANRPAAGVVSQLKQRATLSNRDNVVEQLWFGLWLRFWL